jgi:hypothetical protein
MTVDLSRISTTYFNRRVKSTSTAVRALTAELTAEIRQVRHEARVENGGGGMSHVVGEYLEFKYGWPRPYVTVLSDDGKVICAPHVVNILPDGSLLDSTRDQFGFADDIAIIRAGSAEMANYRPEFDRDWFPRSRDDEDGHLIEYHPTYLGKPDDELANRNSDKLGRGWWLRDPTLLDAYDAVDAEYRQSSDLRM